MYQADKNRYQSMKYNRCGNSGLKLPTVSLGLWHNFGDTGKYETMKEMCFTAFDHGITHFDLANNYGPGPGSAEIHFGRILKEELKGYRDELIISTKAGYDMWEGPYGDGGSRKYLLASLDQSLKRMGLEYVDIFYHHRMDPETPLEETMGALHQAVLSGKALYAGLSNYDGPTMEKACKILDDMKCPFVINQNSYNIFNRTIEQNGLKEMARKKEFREQFDLCVSRAVANLSTLSEYCLPYIQVGGIFVPYKSGEIDDEVEQSKKAVRILGGNIKDVMKFELPGTDIHRSFVLIHKEQHTQKKYPRKAGIPAKEPL